MKILALSGSLRAASSNTAALRAAALLAPPGVEIEVYESLGALPHFNPDLEDSEPAVVTDFRARVREADGLMISSPEYAHGVPGVMKNALDWLVGGSEFIDMPVALINATPPAAYSQASITETLTVMSAHLVAAASIELPLRGRKLDAAGIAADPGMAEALRAAIAAFVEAIPSIPRFRPG